MLEQQLFNALSLGSVYALFALGFTLVFGVLGVVNLSHGAVFMVGAYAALQATTHLGFGLWAALAFAFVFSGLLGLLIDVLVLRPLRARNAPHLIPMIATIGLGITFNSLVQGLFGPENQRFPAEVLPQETLRLMGLHVTALDQFAQVLRIVDRLAHVGPGIEVHDVGPPPGDRAATSRG